MQSPVQEIKDRLNIADVVSRYVKLEPAGKNLKGKSPFTNEKTPSFFVSPEKGLYHCFSTGKGGDIFTFVEEMEGLDFAGALKVLAEQAGVTLGKFDKQKSDEKDVLFEIVEEATKFFEESLKNSTEAMNYLESRGVSPETIALFRIGYAPAGWRNLFERLSPRFKENDLISAGLSKKSEGRVYDAFRDRIMFPIMDTSGRPIAFSGRILHPDEKSAKYVNSPETPLFNKGSVLFALDKAKNYIRKYDFTIMAEGQFDVIMLHQNGFRNAVGISGTALTESLVGPNGTNNLGLVKRLSDKIVLALDSDSAGVKASIRSAHIAMALGMDIKIAKIPSGKDPADFLKAEGKDAFAKVLREAKHLVEFETLEAKARAKDLRDLGNIISAEVLGDVANLPSEIEKSFFVKKISDITTLPEKAIFADLAKIGVKNENFAFAAAPKEKKTREEKIVRELFALFFSQNEDKKISEKLSGIIGEDNFKKYYERFSKIKQELSFEAEVFAENLEDRTLEEMFQNLEEDFLDEKIKQLSLEIREKEKENNDKEMEELTGKYQALVKKSAEIKNSRYINKF